MLQYKNYIRHSVKLEDANATGNSMLKLISIFMLCFGYFKQPPENDSHQNFKMFYLEISKY